jgi:hypothetical protein
VLEKKRRRVLHEGARAGRNIQGEIEALFSRLDQEIIRPIRRSEFQASCAMGGFVLPTSLDLEEHIPPNWGKFLSRADTRVPGR